MTPLEPRVVGILGGGPAGLSAALWLRNLGFAPWIADAQARSGGMQNFNFLANDWVLGQVGMTGPELAGRFNEHIRELDIPLWTGCRSERIEREGIGYRVTLADAGAAQRQERCEALLVATGTRFRGREVFADLPGIDTVPADRWAFGPYAFADMDRCAGKRLLIVGGGDNAYENTRLLMGTAASIDMVLRSPPRAQQVLREAVAGRARIYQSAGLVAMHMAGDCIEAVLRTVSGDERIMVDRIHVLAGYEPNTAFLRTAFAGIADFRFDGAGYLVTDQAGRTGVHRIYAAGDVCNPEFPSVVASLAQGARAAKTIELDLRQP